MHNDSLPPSDRADLPAAAPGSPALRADLARFRKNSGWSNAKIAAAIGYNQSVISQYLNLDKEGNPSPEGNIYTGDIPAIEKRLREFLRDQRLLLDTGIESIETDASRKITEYLEDIRTSRGFGVIIAEPGIGKSRALDRYCADHELAIIFTAWEGECSRACAEDLLVKAAEVTRGKQHARDLIEKLRGSNRMIIVDDAHYLTGPALSLLCGFRERTGVSLALVGISRLVEKLAADPQRLSRVNFQRQIRFNKLKDVDALITHHVNALLGDLDGETAEVMRLCRVIVSHAGHFRSLHQELARAVRLHRGKPDWPWSECLRKAHRLLIRDYDLPADSLSLTHD